MRLKCSELRPKPDAPFAGDVFDRRPFVDSLTSLVRNVGPPFVISIDGRWGSGKTTLLRMWEAHLQGSTPKVLYFNAWETDFAPDPLSAFVSALSELAKKHNPNEQSAKRIEKVKTIGGKIVRRMLPVAIKIVTAGALTADDFTEEALSTLSESLTSDAIAAFDSQKRLIDEFHAALTSLVDSLPSGESESRLLVLVDELDRCRPPYALELLERVKHVLNVRNVVFVFALDKRQLQASVEAVYGLRSRSDEYLRRFIDLEFVLPKPSAEAFTESLLKQLEFDSALAKRIHPELQSDAQNIRVTFNALADLFDLSLRTREQCFTQLRVVLMLTRDDEYLFPDLLVTLIVLRAVAHDIYERFVRGECSVATVMQTIASQPKGDELVRSQMGVWLEALLIGSRRMDIDSAEDTADYERSRRDITSPQNEEEQKRKDRAERILEALSEFRRRRSYTAKLSWIAARIEMGLRLDR
jgi:hypothetical protein